MTKNAFEITLVLCLILSHLCLEVFNLIEAAITRKIPNMPTAPQTPIIESAPHHMLQFPTIAMICKLYNITY